MRKKRYGFNIVAVLLILVGIFVAGLIAWYVISSKPAPKPIQRDNTPRYTVVSIKKLTAKSPGDLSPYPELIVYSDGSGVIIGSQVFNANTFDAQQLSSTLKATDLSSFQDTCTHPLNYAGVEDMTYPESNLSSTTPQISTLYSGTQIAVKGIDCYIATNPSSELSKQLIDALQKSGLGTD